MKSHRKSHRKSKTRSKSLKIRRTRKKCASGYVKSKITGRCVFATGNKGRKLNKKRAAVKLSHKRSGRPSPSQSATIFPSGYTKRGNDGNMWKIKVTSNGIHRWVKA